MTGQIILSPMPTVECNRLDLFPARLRGAVLCIGNFDGVHVGHRAMLQEAKNIAASQGRPWAVMTFNPHPLAVLRPAKPPALLLTYSQRRECLLEFSPDALITVPVTPAFLALSAEDFLTRVIAETLAASHLVEGPGFTFGHQALGTVQTLIAAGPRHGFKVTIMPMISATLSNYLEAPVSSSLIRRLVVAGRMRDAHQTLGRPFTLRGEVIRGAQRGAALGYPTINIQTAQVLPAAAVYAGAALANDQWHPAAISVGTNATFGDGPATVEAFLLNFSGNLYGATVDVQFHRFLRDQDTFSGIDTLVRQIERDVAEVARWREVAAPAVSAA